MELLEDITKDPTSGRGKPEPLKNNLQNCWSRRITQKHRLVYYVKEEHVVALLSCYGHYDDK